jgi:hypothetical protein
MKIRCKSYASEACEANALNGVKRQVPTLKGHEPVPAIDKAIVRSWQGKRPSAMKRRSVRDGAKGRKGGKRYERTTDLI